LEPDQVNTCAGKRTRWHEDGPGVALSCHSRGAALTDTSIRIRRAAHGAAFCLGPLWLGFLSSQPARADDAAPAPSQLTPAVVEAAPQAAPAGPARVDTLSDAPLAETPLSASILDAQHLSERGVESLSAAIRDVPAASDNYNTFGYPEGLQVRGIELDEVLNWRRDGMPTSSHAPLALENKEAVEILYGASGILSGVSAPGGLVNYVLKKPTDLPLRSLQVTVSERGSVETQVDLGGRVGDDGRFGYRINLAAEERRPDIHDAWSQRGFASAFLDWRVSHGTLAEVEVEQHDVREISVPGFGLLDTGGVGYGTTLPAPINPRTNLNDQPWTLPFESRETVGSVRLTQELGENWRVALKIGAQRIRTNDRIAFPDGCSMPTTVYPGLCGNDNIDIYDYRSNGERRLSNSVDLSLHGKAWTGPLEHELMFGVERTHYSERYPQFQAYNYVGTIDALAPTAVPPGPTPQTLNTDTARHLDDWVAFDTVRIAAWSAWVGARASRIAQASAQTDGTEAVSLDQRVVAPFGAIGFQPWSGGFAYVSAGGGVETAAVPNRPIDFSNPGAVLPAMRSRQVELGFKQTGGGGSDWSVALFEIHRPTPELLADASGPPLEVVGAQRQRNRGIDFTTNWRIDRAWLVGLRGELIDARLDDTPDPRFEGWHVTNVAPLSASGHVTWTPASAPGWSLTNLLNFSGRKPVLPANLYDAGAYEVSLPAYWQWDAMTTWRTELFGLKAAWLGGIDNVTNRVYWREAPTASWGATYLFPGAARTFRIALRLDW
jgi:iron complex outermembrane recepter protein